MRSFRFLLPVLLIAAAAPAQRFFASNRTPLSFGAPPGSSDRDFTLDADETIGVFSSDRPGGAGGFDLWIVRRSQPGQAWGTPQAWSGNTASDEIDPGLSADGRRLYFASDRRGRFDLFRATAPAGSTAYGRTQRLGAISDGNADDTGAQPSIDGRRLLFASTRTGAGDIYVATRASGGSWGNPMPLPGVNDPQAADYDPDPEAGGAIVWFSSRRAGGAGGADHYLTWRDRGSGSWAQPLAVSELNGSGDDDGLFTSAISGLTYNNNRGSSGIVIECVCRIGPVGGALLTPLGDVDAGSNPVWPMPVRFLTGATLQLAGITRLSFYDWPDTDNINAYVPAFAANLAAQPVLVPPITLGALELDPASLVALPPVTPDAQGYAQFDLALPSRPALRGQVVYLQSFGLASNHVEMTLPQRITLR